ncbi:FAD:protein FMN transferase [Microbacterium sp.]|uniref:FAD:protein FMN transferase n=1 Tax=Microbacterium sp. TaxID=51671 RepID=UPI001AD0EFE1|nr:FAD:protein FMN transferase [Microbacterium sp.]MBN9156381.1 FAD:protein FMN transferase [Microbacterium sp.]MBS1896372.1 FAD:protein FMN transferase [Actinomycetota bacterium]MBS1899101.1 FAD:protein FMN transferase [Actinomycetota bacterium]
MDHVWRFEAIGTVWEIATSRPLADADRDAVGETIDDFDHTWSRFRDDSLVTALAAEPQEVPAPPDARAMLDLYRELAEATGGAVQPLVGDSLSARGYDARYSLHDRGPLPAPGDWADQLAWDDGALTLHAPALIDVGAIGKGRLVDVVHDLLGALGHAERLVDAGGDLRLSGPPIRVGLEHPFDGTRAIGVAEVADAALCGSAVNRRAWPGPHGGLHHVLDARTGEPVRTVAATWAIAEEAMLADAAATALFFDGGPAFADRFGVEWVRMTTAGAVEWSAGDRMEVFA